MEDMREYFESTTGIGVLATADSAGKVDSAIYGRPHVTGEGEVAFIMTDRLSHRNVTENPHACYLFKEDGKGYRGKRLYLTRLRETQDRAKIEELRRRKRENESDEDRFLVYFSVTDIRPLVGDSPGE